uniref:Histidine-containing phosphotransfer protein n=1 Tax=Ganoderma boninense TaxID=34458 RepID=A0A5K1K5R4_9APHY|nr:Histidine-containing phosphotransfer protein [Ganoderma boninense]
MLACINDSHPLFVPGSFRNAPSTLQTSAIGRHPRSLGSDVASTHTSIDILDTTKLSVRNFLTRLPYASPGLPANPELRREVANVIVSWKVNVDLQYIEGLTETSCSIAESAYAHTSYEHQRVVAIYTACLTYADDLGHRNLEALEQFARRFTRGEPQLHPALDCLTKILKTLHEFCPTISADAIITSTIDSVTAMYIEVVSQGDVISPFATRYPLYLRLKTGIAPAYVHLNFTKSWGDAIGTYYLQIIPELELVTIGFNDMYVHHIVLPPRLCPFADRSSSLSFYKEELARETDNYIHMRASAEQKPAATVLRELVEENLESWHKIKQLAAVQPGLVEICMCYLMGYVEFHFKARRYRLHEVVGSS